jgi:putative CocE/NonD family hydrolase
MPYETRTDLPHPIEVQKHVWIPMRDGVRLAARIWLPRDTAAWPVPGILEYIPYRKNDVYAEGDERRHGYTAAHGYGCVRVDRRGAGDSEGLFDDEYSRQELEDGLDIIAWIAKQPWCTGKVGMIGLSWGGFNSLQIAALAPPALAAIVVIGFSDDRYADDVHYNGGCLFARYQFPWAITVQGYMARPPDPVSVGDRWREMWMQRLNNALPVIEPWLAHQHYDAFWKHGSVCEDYAAIRCPVFAVGAWLDGYTNPVFRMLEHHAGPCRGLIGPWGHQNPYYGVPGPAIGWMQETLRWWDHWLKGIDTGVMAEPKFRFYRQDARGPGPTLPDRPGAWTTEPAWPSPNVSFRALALGDRTLGDATPAQVTLTHRGKLVSAADPGNWAGFAMLTDEAADQRPEDGQALAFDGAQLAAPVEILGLPRARLELAVDRPCALLAVRLCDVAPDGRSTLVTRGFLNLTHHRSRERPRALKPGERISIEVELKAISYVVPAGHRLRLALATAYWPWIWPSPELVTLTVFTGGVSALELPVRKSPAVEAPVPAHFSKPEAGPGLGIEIQHLPRGGRTATLDAATGRQLIVDAPAFFASARLPDYGGLEFGDHQTDECEITEGDPISAKLVCRRSLPVGRGDWQTRIEVVATMTSTCDHFLVTTVLEAFENDRRVHARTWTHTIPRQLV